MPHENRVRIDPRVGFLLIRHADEIVEPSERDRLAAGHGRGELCVRLRRDADQRQILEIGPVVAGWFCASQRELGGDVFRRKIASARADAAAFEQIA